LDEFITVNRRNYHQYCRELGDLPGVRMLTWDEFEKRNYQYIVLEFDEHSAGMSRDRLVQILHAENVRARRYFYPGCHRMEPYHSYFPHAGLLLPETEKLVQRVLTLPTGTAVKPEDVGLICQVIKFAIAHSREIEQEWVRRGTAELR
jgi:dTDP-4-amino-4,6-dideoxygalactose transaminase